VSRSEKIALAVRIWLSFFLVRLRLRRRPLPELATRLGKRGRAKRAYPPARLGRAVDRCLRIGRWQPTCLAESLVLFRLLRRQGEAALLVIGLPEDAKNKDAHAWVEIDGVDVGPPPGRGANVAMARFG
jgi:hypothetical protein